MKNECMSAHLQNILGLRKLILITLMMTTMTMKIMLVMSVTTLRVYFDNSDDAEGDDGR